MLLNSEGEQEELACFERDENIHAFSSCFVNWNNQLFSFGGNTDSRQISRLTGNKLEKVGSLDFDDQWSVCSVMANRLIFLCFNGYLGDKKCRRSTGPLEQFSTVSLSNYSHSAIQISSSYSKS